MGSTGKCCVGDTVAFPNERPRNGFDYILYSGERQYAGPASSVKRYDDGFGETGYNHPEMPGVWFEARIVGFSWGMPTGKHARITEDLGKQASGIVPGTVLVYKFLSSGCGRAPSF